MKGNDFICDQQEDKLRAPSHIILQKIHLPHSAKAGLNPTNSAVGAPWICNYC